MDICGYLWIFVDICGYSIQSYLHAGRPKKEQTKCAPAARALVLSRGVHARRGNLKQPDPKRVSAEHFSKSKGPEKERSAEDDNNVRPLG